MMAVNKSGGQCLVSTVDSTGQYACMTAEFAYNLVGGRLAVPCRGPEYHSLN
ncbi:MAG: hypothetical protein ACI8PP_000185 [Candidatus Pseudothioglobus sp.]|jgi:hypothetical protein